MNHFGFVRLSCASIETEVANPRANAGAILEVLAQLPDSDIGAAQAAFSAFSWAYQPSNDTGLPLKLRHRLRDTPASAGFAAPLSGRR